MHRTPLLSHLVFKLSKQADDVVGQSPMDVDQGCGVTSHPPNWGNRNSSIAPKRVDSVDELTFVYSRCVILSHESGVRPVIIGFISEMPQIEHNLVDRYLSELLNQGDFAKADEILTPDFIFCGPSTRDGLDCQGFMRFIIETRAAFSNKQFTELERIAEGDRIALRFRMTGTNDGSFHGMPPLGATIDVEGCDLIYVRDSKIARVRAYFDLMTVIQRFLIPLPVRLAGEVLSRFWPH
jgi:steroid delta-isomerase-like uncharacterized protein